MSSKPQIDVAARRTILLVFFFSIFVNALMLIGPLFMLQLYDRVLPSNSIATLYTLFGLVAFLYLAMAILDFSRARLLGRLASRLRLRYGGDLFQARHRKQSVRAKDDDTIDSRGGLESLKSVVAALQSPSAMSLFDLPFSPLFVVVLFMFHPLLGWLGVAGMALVTALRVINQIITKGQVIKSKQLSAQENAVDRQAVQGREVLLAHGILHHIRGRWSAVAANSVAVEMGYSDTQGAFSSFSKTFRMFLQSAMLALGAWLVLKGQLSPGAMIAGSILLGRAMAPVDQMLGGWQVLQGGAMALKTLRVRIRDLQLDDRKIELPRNTPSMSFHRIIVGAPGSDKPALMDVSAQVESGEVLAILGKSGSGKSSLIRSLVGVWPVLSGKIKLGGVDYEQYPEVSLGRMIGYLPQDVRFFDGTIAENIARLDPEAMDADIIKAAKRAHVHDLIVTLPEGYNTVLNADNLEISGGQRQRIALARALFGDPDYLILDEPNANLDQEGCAALAKSIEEMKAAGKVVVMSSHRQDGLSGVDKFMVLENGRVNMQATNDQVAAILKQLTDKASSEKQKIEKP